MANMSFTNNAATTLASSITNVATSLTVATATGALFPTLSGSKYFYCTLTNTAGAVEIIKVTARSTDTFTMTRGQDNTSGLAWATGDKVELRLVTASLDDFPKLDEVNTFTGANAYGTPASIVLTNATGTAASLTVGTASALTTGNSYQVSSLGVGTAASGTAGEIRATNNITAYYSDDRFKTNLGNIPEALAKVMTLNGFYYEANELAQSFGYEKKSEIGVSAQQVQAILPEVVAPAPIDENYLTVRYERLVPLLIEAIKELNTKVNSLESK